MMNRKSKALSNKRFYRYTSGDVGNTKELSNVSVATAKERQTDV